MDPVTGAVVMVGLGTVGPPTAKLVTDFLGRVLAPTGDAVGQALAHPVVEWQKVRVARAQKLVELAAEQLAEHGHEPVAVPGRVLMPILEGGSLEDDGALRQTWANLLARAASSKTPEVLPAFAAMLSRLSPVEAAVLGHHFAWLTHQENLEPGDVPIDAESVMKDHGVDLRTAGAFLGNFVALGICRYGSPTLSASSVKRLADFARQNELANTKGGYRIIENFLDLDLDQSRVHLTPLGVKFLESCSPLEGGPVPEAPGP